jgi:hypothetical protein
VTRTYAVGDTGPGTGKIFYVASTPFACGPDLLSSCKYLEAQPTLVMNQWCFSGPMSNTVTSPAFSSAIGAGYWNTRKMLAGCNSPSSLAYSMTAAYGGQSDCTCLIGANGMPCMQRGQVSPWNTPSPPPGVTWLPRKQAPVGPMSWPARPEVG